MLPCGAGKTIVGLPTMADIQRATLILTPNTVAVRQWISEILDKTDIPPEMVGEYTGDRKDICPITVSTYQILDLSPFGRRGLSRISRSSPATTGA